MYVVKELCDGDGDALKRKMQIININAGNS